MQATHHDKVVCWIAMMALCLCLPACQANAGVPPGPPASVTATAPVVTLADPIPPAATATPTSSPTPAFTPTSIQTPTPKFTATPLPTLTPKPPPFFETFVKSLVNNNKGQVVGVYVEGVLALKVVQQPASNPGYVSTLGDTATYFALSKQMAGNTGLLAHNYLAGVYYFDLQPGQSVILIYGDGRTEEYVVQKSDRYRAVSPNSPTSNFVNLTSGETLNSTDLFYRVYGGSARTTFQTCIAQGNESSWGRLFVIAPQK